MMTEIKGYNFLRRLLGGMTQDVDKMFSSSEELFDFCLGFVKIKGRVAPRAEVGRLSKQSAADQLSILNALSDHVWFSGVEAAVATTWQSSDAAGRFWIAGDVPRLGRITVFSAFIYALYVRLLDK